MTMRLPILLTAVLAGSLLAACATPAPTALPTVEPPTQVPEVSTPTAAAEAEWPEIDPLQVVGDIRAAGSSTVYPLLEKLAERFREDGYSGNLTIDSIGTGAGMERFCKAGETDIANASRRIKDSELESCKAIGRDPIEFRIGTDGLAVVVHPENDWLTDGVTLEQLAELFSADNEKWSDVNPDWPNEPIKRFAPGTDSGTFDFFVEVVMDPLYVIDKEADKGKGETKHLEAKNLQQSEDDNVLVTGVAGDRYAIGYFGYAYYAENPGQLKIVKIDGVEPNMETVEDGSYPLARPLFLYSDAKIMREKPQVAAFIAYVLTHVNEVIQEVGYFPASESALKAAKEAWLAATAQ